MCGGASGRLNTVIRARQAPVSHIAGAFAVPSGRHAAPGTAGLSPTRGLFTPDTADRFSCQRSDALVRSRGFSVDLAAPTDPRGVFPFTGTRGPGFPNTFLDDLPFSSIAHKACSEAGCGPLSVAASTFPLNRDRPSVALPGMLCAMRVHCLLVFLCLGHYHAIVEGPKE